jgi:hypothetical protein
MAIYFLFLHHKEMRSNLSALFGRKSALKFERTFGGRNLEKTRKTALFGCAQPEMCLIRPTLTSSKFNPPYLCNQAIINHQFGSSTTYYSAPYLYLAVGICDVDILSTYWTKRSLSQEALFQ